MMSEDEILVQKSLNGEKDAFGLLVDKYKDAVCGLAYSKVRNFHDAQDIAQEAFIDAYTNLRNLKYPHRFSSWIYTIAINRCRMWARKRSSDSVTFVSFEELNSEAVLENQSIRQNNEDQILDQILDFINKLPEANRLVAIMYYVNGLTCKEIGKFTGTSINTIMSKLHRVREQLRKEFTEMPEQTLTQQKISLEFTIDILKAIERFLPIPQAPSNPITKIGWIPWAVSIIIGILTIGIMNIPHLTSLGYTNTDVIEDSKLVNIYSIIDSKSIMPLSNQNQGSKSTSIPPLPEENALYAVNKQPDLKAKNDQIGIIQCQLSSGDLLTYKIHKDILNGDIISHSIDETQTLLINEVSQDGLMQIINIGESKLTISKREPMTFAGIGLLYIGGDGHREFKLGPPFAIIAGNAILSSPEDPFFVTFPDKPLKKGDTWNYNSSLQQGQASESKYTVIKFEKVKGYNCVILEREQDLPEVRKTKIRMACDVQSGMVVKLDAEILIRKHSEGGGRSDRDSTERVVVELTQKEQLKPESMEMERQAFDKIGTSLTEHRYIELDELHKDLEEIKKEYPNIRLMPGLNGMIKDVDQRIAEAAKEAERKYTYRDQMYIIARNLVMYYEGTGKYTNLISGLTSERTPLYEYSVKDIEGSGKDAKCKIIAKGKKGTPAEGEAWFLELSASNGISEIKPYIEPVN